MYRQSIEKEIWMASQFSSVQSLSRVQVFATPWTAAPWGCPSPWVSLSFTISQSLLKFMSIRLVMDIQPFQLLSFPSPTAFNLSQHQGLFQWLSSSHQEDVKYCSFSFRSVLPMNIQDWFPLGWTGLVSLQSKGLSRVFSNTTVQKHQFFSAQPSSQSNSHIHTRPLEKP